jgi:ATP-dependent exoDNAse (exonuclease V) beta subunit
VDQAARAAHEQWQAGRQRVLSEASRPGAVRAVTTLAEAALPGQTMSARDDTSSLVSRSAALRLGKAVHEALRSINIGATTQSPQLGGPAVRLLHSPVEREEAERLVHNILASPVMSRARIARERFAELPFVLHTGGRVLEGVIDLAFVEDENWVIVDFKTDAVDTADVEARALQYRPQLDLYALALERLTARSVKEMLVLFARSQQSVCFAWDDRARTRAEALWQKES